MPAVLRVRDKDGNVIDIPSIKGADGKSAYQSAVDGGYKGTEEEFNSLLANIGVTTEKSTEAITGITTNYFMPISSFDSCVSLYLYADEYEGHEIKGLKFEIDGTWFDVKDLSAYDGRSYMINMGKLVRSDVSGKLHVITLYSPHMSEFIDGLTNYLSYNFELEIYL